MCEKRHSKLLKGFMLQSTMECYNCTHFGYVDLNKYYNEFFLILPLLILKTNIVFYTVIFDKDDFLNINTMTDFYKKAAGTSAYFNLVPDTLLFRRDVSLQGVFYLSKNLTHLQQVLNCKPSAIIFPPLKDTEFDLKLFYLPPKTNIYSLQGQRLVELYHPLRDGETRKILMAAKQLNGVWALKEKAFQEAKFNLSGTTVRVGMLAADFIPYFKVVKVFDLHLKNKIFVDKLQDFLKFQFKVVVEFIKMKEIKSFSHLQRQLTLLEKGDADVMATFFVLNAERASAHDFVQMGIDTRFHFVVRKPQYIYDWKSPIRVFKPEVWFCLGLSILITTACLGFVAAHLVPEEVSFSTSFIMIFGYSCNQGYPKIPSNLSIRLICLTCLLFSLVVYQDYVSNFYSFLSTQTVNAPFTSLEEFIEKKQYSLIMDPETSLYSAMKKSERGILKDVWDTFLMNDPRHMLNGSNTQEVLERVCKGESVILALQYTTLIAKAPCPVVALSPGYFRHPIVLLERKDFPFTDHFRYVILRCLESGLLHNRKEVTSFQHTTSQKTSKEPITVEQVLLLLGFYAVMIFTSLGILFMEMVYFYYVQKHDMTSFVFSD